MLAGDEEEEMLIIYLFSTENYIDASFNNTS